MSDQPPNPPNPDQKQTINVNNSKGTVIGNFNQVVQNFLADPKMKYYLMALGILVVAVGLGLYFSLNAGIQKANPTPTERVMTAKLNVAVSEFTVKGQSSDLNLGRNLADILTTELKAQLQQLSSTGSIETVEVWGPGEIRKVNGSTAEERNASAAQIAQRSMVDILVYGEIQAGQPVKVTPVFFISSRDFYDAVEITGQHTLGSTFPVRGEPGSAPFRTALDNQMAPRVRTLALVVRGLLNFTIPDYDQAIATLKLAVPDPDSPQATPNPLQAVEGRKLIYLLMGNAAMYSGQNLANISKDYDGAAKKYEQANKYFQVALLEDPEYARAMISTASLYYMQALLPAARINKVTDVDDGLIQKSIDLYRQALQAKNQPPQADVSTKVHFGLGQCYLMRAIIRKQDSAAQAIAVQAIAELNAVIQDYEKGDPDTQNRLRVMAAVSHGHLGEVFEMQGKKPEALKEYETAVDLLSNTFNSERLNHYTKKVEQLKQ